MTSPPWSALRAFAAKMRGLFHKHDLDCELSDEVEEHLRLLAARFESQGMSKEDASAAARRPFGNLTALQEDRRGLQTFLSLEALWHDIRYELRTLRRESGFLAVAVVSLALGIGANTAIFSFADAFLFRPSARGSASRSIDAHYLNAG